MGPYWHVRLRKTFLRAFRKIFLTSKLNKIYVGHNVDVLVGDCATASGPPVILGHAPIHQLTPLTKMAF